MHTRLGLVEVYGKNERPDKTRLACRGHYVDETFRAGHTGGHLLVLDDLTHFLHALGVEGVKLGWSVGANYFLLRWVEGLVQHDKINRVNDLTVRVLNVVALYFATPALGLSQRNEKVKILIVIVLDAELRVSGPVLLCFLIFDGLWDPS